MTGPILPMIDRETYEADRDRLVIHRAIGWLADGRRVTLEDWPTPELATVALGIVQSWGGGWQVDDSTLDILADGLALRLGIDLKRPFGCNIIVDPV